MPNKNKASAMSDASVLTVHDVASYLRLSEAKVYRMARAGIMPAFRLGKSWRFRKDLLDTWMLRETGWDPLSVILTAESTPPVS